MLLMAEMIFHLTFEHGLKNGAKNLLQDVLYVFRALDVVVVEDLLSNLLAWGSWWSFTLCHSVTVLIFVYPSMGHKVDSCNTDLHKLFYTPEKFGQRKALGMSVLWWSIATALTGLATGFKSILGMRMILGVGEAGAYPSNAAITRKWFPKSERATVGGIFDSGQKFGGAFGIPILTWLMIQIGWRGTFAILGVLGIIWAIVWFAFF